MHDNTEFVNMVMKKCFYEKLETKTKKPETAPAKLIQNAMPLAFKT